jgi:uncharacterized membrane protein YphA (DoxX/SURF4 family)
MNIVRTICRILVGLVFVYSGFVKGIDPIGSAYKFHDYFAAFNMNYLQFLDMPLSIFLSSAEFLIGVAMILGIRLKIASWALLIFMSFFTILTLILALFNPVSDCGCFGDALTLSNWQTFYKNIILMVLTLVIFFTRNQFQKNDKVLEEWLILIIVLCGFLFVVNYCLNHLPIIDFRPYKVGTDIVKDMSRPEGAVQDSFKTTLIYKKNTEVKEFDLDNIPWKDTTWKWVETKVIRVKEGYKPPIHDFSIKSFAGSDITNEVLTDHDYSFLLIAKDLSTANKRAFERANAIANYCKTGHCKFYALTSSSISEVDSLKKSKVLVFDFYITDGTALKTINRANPGLMLIRDGLVLAQWHYNDFPNPAEIGNNLMAYTLSVSSGNSRHLTGWLMVFILMFTLLAFKFYQMRTD